MTKTGTYRLRGFYTRPITAYNAFVSTLKKARKWTMKDCSREWKLLSTDEREEFREKATNMNRHKKSTLTKKVLLRQLRHVINRLEDIGDLEIAVVGRDKSTTPNSIIECGNDRILGLIHESPAITQIYAECYGYIGILEREERWHERGIKEAIYERLEHPDLNKQGGLRFQLSHAWDRTIGQISRRLFM